MRTPDAIKDSLRRLIDPLFTQIAVSAGYRTAQSIPLALQKTALAETAEYVRSKMSDAIPFKTSKEVLLSALEQTRKQDGLILEFGVWKGNTLRSIAHAAGQKVYGFDSFQGLPENWRAGMGAGVFALKRPPRVPANAELVVGWFNETLDPFLVSHPGPIKFLHIDCDLYSSTLTVLNKCIDRLTTGSVIVFDEYFNYAGWREGEFRAFQEIITAKDLSYRYLGYARSDEQVAIEIVSPPTAGRAHFQP